MRRFKSISRSACGGVRRSLFASALSLLLLNVWAAAQGQTSRYVYDDDGRLRAVIAPGGEAVVYEYDAAGNFTAVRRLGADALELLTFAPRSGLPGTVVFFYGVGFGAGVSSVTFGGGAAGTLVGFTNSTVTAVVPEGAATGPVTIDTARGAVTTAAPFVLQGVVVNPKEASVLDGDSVQFTATVIVPGNEQEVVWSVNGVEGGSDALGRIDEAGLYTAPPDPPATFEVTVQAASLVFPTLVGAATVRVRSLSDFRFTLSPAVAVGKGPDFTNAGVLSQAVSIGKGPDFSGAALSPAVSVGKGPGYSEATAFGPGVSLTNGPVVTSVSPSSVAAGNSVNVTLGGSNFGGATSVSLFDPNGSAATNVTVSNVSVGGGGSSLTMTLAVQAGAAAGRRIIVVTTAKGHSVTSDVNVNTIQITAP